MKGFSKILSLPIRRLCWMRFRISGAPALFHKRLSQGNRLMDRGVSLTLSGGKICQKILFPSDTAMASGRGAREGQGQGAPHNATAIPRQAGSGGAAGIRGMTDGGGKPCPERATGTVLECMLVSAAGFEPTAPGFIPLQLSLPLHLHTTQRSWSGLSLYRKPEKPGY